MYVSVYISLHAQLFTYFICRLVKPLHKSRLVEPLDVALLGAILLIAIAVPSQCRVRGDKKHANVLAMIKIAHSFLHKQLFERQNDSICCLLLAEEEKQEPPKKKESYNHTHTLFTCIYK